MHKFVNTLLGACFALSAAASFAATDVNKANQAELEAVKGIGPAMSTRILDERKKSTFKDWADLASRVKGVGSRNATKFSAEGMTVNGASFTALGSSPDKTSSRVARAGATSHAAK